MALSLKAMKSVGANVTINTDEFVRKLQKTEKDVFLVFLNDAEEELSYSKLSCQMEKKKI